MFVTVNVFLSLFYQQTKSDKSHSICFQFEFLDASVGTCTYISAFVLALEWVSSKHRVLSCTIISLFYPIGEIALGLLAMFIPEMRTLLLIVYACGLVIVSFYWLIPESVRWLLVTGRVDRARKILRKAAKANNKVLSSEAEAIIDEKALEAQTAKENKEQDIPISAIFKSKVLVIRLIVCSLCWIVTYLDFYGLALSATAIQGDGNKYLSFILVIMAELPGTLAMNLLLDRIGRRRTLSGSLCMAGVIMLGSQLIAHDQIVLKRLTFFLSMTGISTTFCSIYVYTAELWPTSTRSALMSVCSTVGRFGAIAAPLTVLLVRDKLNLKRIRSGV